MLSPLSYQGFGVKVRWRWHLCRFRSNTVMKRHKGASGIQWCVPLWYVRGARLSFVQCKGQTWLNSVLGKKGQSQKYRNCDEAERQGGSCQHRGLGHLSAYESLTGWFLVLLICIYICYPSGSVTTTTPAVVGRCSGELRPSCSDGLGVHSVVSHLLVFLLLRQPLCERGGRAVAAGNPAAPEERVRRPPDAAQEQPPSLQR